MQLYGVRLSLLLPSLLLALASSGAAQKPGLTPYAHVVDLDTGVGIASVAVSIPGTNKVEYTDSYGYVYFPGYQPAGKFAAAFSFPATAGYGPAYASRRKTNPRLLNLFVPPHGDPVQIDDGVPKSNGGYYYSRLIDHEAGTGSQPIQFLSASERMVEGALTYFPFDMEIDVPPGTYHQDFRIRVYPLPTYAPITHDGYAPDLSHGQWHVDALDANGNLISGATFNKGILFRTKPFWTEVDLAALDNGLLQSASVQVDSFNFNSMTWIKEEVMVSAYPAQGRIGIELTHFSIYSSENCYDCHPAPTISKPQSHAGPVKASGPGQSQKTGKAGLFTHPKGQTLFGKLREAVTPKVTFKLACYECEPLGVVSVFGGQGVGTASFLMESQSGWSLGAGVEATLSATASGGSGFLAKFLVDAKIEAGISLTVGANGQINGLTTKSIGGSVGGTLGPSNFNGIATTNLVYQVFDIYIDGDFLGQSNPVPAFATAILEGDIDGVSFSLLGPCADECPDEEEEEEEEEESGQ